MATTRIVMTAGRAVGMAVRQLELTVEAGGSGAVVMTGTRLAIGSHPSNDLVLEDARVSRFHARVAASDGGYRIEDLDSANGTFVNGVRVRDAYVADGARIALGGCTVRARHLDSESEVELAEEERFGEAIGRSVAMRALFARARRAAASEATVVLLGETGTGKDVLARAIHQHSARAAGPFVVLDCGAVAPTLIEAALFGHERGAFTGADVARAGVFERAAHGTLFLDEIGELPMELQPKLLRALESGTITRVGGTASVTARPRIVAATHRDLQRMVEAERFRADLYYRLAVVALEVPALRDRPEDIPLLAAHFLRDVFARDGADPAWVLPHIDDTFGGLVGHTWPGNARELRNAVERAAALADPRALASGGLGQLAAVREGLRAARTGRVLPLAEAREQFDRDYLRDTLAATSGDLQAAADRAGIHRKSLERLLRKLHLRNS